MTPEKDEYIKNWLTKANEDIAVIIELSSVQPEFYTTAICFHSQQAVEKLLKAFLVYKDIEFTRTHDVDYLLSICMNNDKIGFSNINLLSLSDYAVEIRYPDDFMIPSVEQAIMYKDIALNVKKVVESKIQFD